MLHTYTYPEYEYRQSDEQRSGERVRHPVVVIGAGPVGMTQALDCAARGIPTVVLDDNNTVSIGSPAHCYAKRPVEIWDRLGLGDDLVAQGVQWKVGKVFFRDELVYQFDLLPEDHHKMPAMINLQQYYLEERLVRACDESPLVDLRWKHKVLAIETHDDHVVLTIETPDGIFKTEASWLIACDGASSDTRRMIGADFTGQFFQDRFLIADVVMKADFPTERWFWFDPPFHRNQSVLLHKQCDNVWRIDFQLGWDADPNEEKKPEKVIPRIQAMLGDDREFELEWVSVYTFQCRRMNRFNHGRVLFVGDAAHQVSPFGARGANSGIQDTDNLIWKLNLVLEGKAPATLLDTYSEERCYAADENIMNSTRSTDFITPKGNASKTLRKAVLTLARHHPFARKLVNSGRLSVPSFYVDSSLNTPDCDAFNGRMVPGAPMDDAPVTTPAGTPGWLLNHMGNRFQLLYYTEDASTIDPATAATLTRWAIAPVPIEPLVIATQGTAPDNIATLHDGKGRVRERYDLTPGSVYLLRPDQHVAARWRTLDPDAIDAALARATYRDRWAD